MNGFFQFLFFAVVFLPGVVGGVSAADTGSLPVFPGAVGFGTRTPAGGGRHVSPPQTTVIVVSSLADSGAGSLRDCISRSVPRTCVFVVGGRIPLATELLVDKPYLTIAGQTAPSPGILITGAGMRIATHDVLVQHLQILPGDAKTGPKPENRDGVNVAGKSGQIAKNVVLDHLSIGWAVDENFDIWYNTTSDVTLSNSIVGEALYKSIHPKGAHSMGLLVGDGVKRVSLHHNVLAHNNDRNPRLKPGSQTEFVANVVYNWGGSTSWNQANLSDSDRTGLASQLIFIGNFYKAGAANMRKLATVYASPASNGTKVFVLGNLGPTRTGELQGEWLISSLRESLFRALVPPFPLTGIQSGPAIDNYQNVLRTAGSRPRESNSVDRRIISEVTFGTGTLKDCVSGCTRTAGGYPALSPKSAALSLPSNPNGDSNGNGYTNLEDWLFERARAVE